MLFELQFYTKVFRIRNLSQYPIISVVRERRSDRHSDRERESLDFSVVLKEACPLNSNGGHGARGIFVQAVGI